MFRPLFSKAVKIKVYQLNKKEKILLILRNTIDLQIQVLGDIKTSLNASFSEVALLLSTCAGKIVITGVGKSAVIAQKMVATLNSTGSHAAFLHGGDAAHGDVGIIHPGDIAIFISKSGESEELKKILPLLKEQGIATIAIHSSPSSTLAELAAYDLYLPILREADPHNLAPTTSSTAQMVVGDAIAIALLELKGFSKDDFARVHPGGNLGRRLTLRVADIYTDGKPLVNHQSQLKDIIIEMTRHRLGATAVIQEGKVMGIITDGDLRRMLQKKTDLSEVTAIDIMSSSPRTTCSDTLVIDALETMRKNKISQLLIVDDADYRGIIHLHDILKTGLV